jgi:hypothetical protein
MTIQFLNLGQFNKAVNDFASKIVPADFNKFIRGLAFKVLRGVVFKTPVDTGRARANWQVNVGSLNNKELQEADKIGSSTIEKGLARLAQLKRKGIGEIIYIFNNVPYIIALEDGHSKRQAPNGMVKVTLTEIAAGLK